MTMTCLVMVQAISAADAEPIAAEDVKFSKFKLEIIPVDYVEDGPVIPKVSGGKRMKYPMFLLEYQWDLEEKSKKKYKDAVAENGFYYIDRMEFEWRVVLAQPTTGKSVKSSGKGFNITQSKSLRMRTKVRYANINNDGSHYACVFIEPRMIERLFRSFKPNYVFIELVVRIGGDEALRLNSHGEDFAFMHKGDNEKVEKKLIEFMPKRRSTDASFFLSEKVREVNGVLLGKNETPWKGSQLNVFETIVESEKK